MCERDIQRETLIKAADALEDLMCECGDGKTATRRKLWAACYPLWVLVQAIFRKERCHKDDD